MVTLLQFHNAGLQPHHLSSIGPHRSGSDSQFHSNIVQITCWRDLRLEYRRKGLAQLGLGRQRRQGPVDRAKHHAAAQTVEIRDVAGPFVDDGRDQHHSVDHIGRVERPGERYDAAEGIAHQGRIGDPDLAGCRAKQIGLFSWRLARFVQGVGVTVAGAVESDNRVGPGQLVHQAERVVPHAAACAVQQDHGRTAALAEEMHAGALHTDKFALGRVSFLGLYAGSAGRKTNSARGNGPGASQQ